MSYAVVKNQQLEFYAVPKKWTKVDDNGKQYILYPPTKFKKYVKTLKDPEDNWLKDAVDIVCNDIPGELVIFLFLLFLLL